MSDQQEPKQLGVVVGGSLTKSLKVRLDPNREAGLGQYVMAPLGEGRELLGMVTDILLESAEAGPTSWPPPAGDDTASRLLREVLLDTGVYTAVEVNPYLEVDPKKLEPQRARALPRHFAPVRLADQATIDAAFETGDKPAIKLGTPLGMEGVDIFADIEKLFERSLGIFGKSGTGKSVLAMQSLDAMVQNSANQRTNAEKTVALIFDMHNDYGWDMKFQGGDGAGKRRSLKQRHQQDVCVYHLEPATPNIDGPVYIGTRDIDPEDLDVLQDTAYFTAAAIEAAFECENRFGKGWIDEILEDDPSPAVIRKAWKDGDEPDEVNWAKVVARFGVHAGSFENLRRGLRRIVRREFVRKGSSQVGDVINHIIQTLQGGKTVVVQFGKYGSDLTSYMLVANMLSRRIWDRYREAKESAQGKPEKEPNRLVIVIEEAHKFIDRRLAGQTIFGQIARELRKYNVTLLVIDQRPSQIDPEVLSQIGTRFCLQLDSEQDVDALVGGIAGRSGLRQVIASLESRQQALAFGHALPMPVVVTPPTLTADSPPGATLRARLGAPPPREATPNGLFG